MTTTPLLLYKLDQTSSGTGPTSILDTSSGAAVNLSITYGTGSAWTSNGKGNGWISAGTAGAAGSGAKSAALNGTKVATALNGSKVLTYEFFINVPNGAATAAGTVFDIEHGSSANGLAGVYKKTNSHTWEIWFPDNTTTEGFTVPMPTAGVDTHVVIEADTTQATTANRCKVWYNGVAQTVTTVSGTAQNTTMTVDSTSNVFLGDSTFDSNETWYFVAVYSSLLPVAEIVAHSNALAANNDLDPTQTVIAPPRGVPTDVMVEEPLRRRALLASAGSAAPAAYVLARPAQPRSDVLSEEPLRQRWALASAVAQIEPGALAQYLEVQEPPPREELPQRRPVLPSASGAAPPPPGVLFTLRAVRDATPAEELPRRPTLAGLAAFVLWVRPVRAAEPWCDDVAWQRRALPIGMVATLAASYGAWSASASGGVKSSASMAAQYADWHLAARDSVPVNTGNLTAWHGCFGPTMLQ